MTGRVQEKKGYWYVIINRGSGLTPKWVSTGLKVSGNKRRALQMVDKIIADFKDGQDESEPPDCGALFRQADNPLFIEVIDAYMSVAKLTVKINTYEKYGYAAKNHVVPHFKKRGIRIKDLTTLDLQMYFNEKMSTLTKKTLRDHKTVINKSLKYAIETLKLIQYDPAVGVWLGKVEEPITQFYTEEQLNELMERIVGQGIQIEAPVILAAYYGLRREEVMALQWSAIDFTRKEVCIRRTAIMTSAGTVYANTVKSNSSYRTMPLFPDVERYLRDLYEHQNRMQTALKKGYTNNQEICRWEDGRVVQPGYVTKRLRILLKKFDMPPLTFHQIRHSTASLLLSKGYSLKEIQEWLGHADIKSTYRYSHLDKSFKEGMAATIGENLHMPKSCFQCDF